MAKQKPEMARRATTGGEGAKGELWSTGSGQNEKNAVTFRFCSDPHISTRIYTLNYIFILC